MGCGWPSEQLVITHNYTARDNECMEGGPTTNISPHLPPSTTGHQTAEGPAKGKATGAYVISNFFAKLLLKEEIIIPSEGLG